METTMAESKAFGFSTAIWHCGYDGSLISFDGDVAFDSMLGNAHRKPGLHLHDVFLLCLQRASARVAIQELETVLANADRSEGYARKLQDVVLIDGTFARQNVILRPYAGISVIWTEISDIRSEAVKYRRQANHDPLTGLLNRRGFELSISGHCKSRRGMKGTTLLLVDLDNFKNVNDLFGHDSGDRVLIHTAECLKHVFGLSSLIARVGGDEFAVLHIHTASDFCLETATEKLNTLVRKNEFAPGEATGLGVSLGAVRFEGQPTPSISQILKDADRELYACKKSGKAQARLRHDPEGFSFHFQPVVDVRSSEVLGFEALLRPDGVQHAPRNIEALVQDLEQSGSLAQIEKACLGQVTDAFHALRNGTGKAFEFSINVCQQQWNDTGFAAWLDEELSKAGMPHDKLRVELLESTRFGAGPCQVVENMTGLADLGISVDLDDFGQAGASLDRLKLPAVGRVKISRQMVQDYWQDLKTRRIVDAIVALSKSMGHRIVVEGIEEDWQLGAFADSGCDLFQGFLFGAPMALADLQDWLAPPHPANWNLPAMPSDRGARNRSV